MKVLFISIMSFIFSISVYAQSYDISEAHAAEAQFKNFMVLCENQEAFYRTQASNLNVRMDQFVVETTDQFERLVNRIEMVEEGKLKDVSEYCDPKAHGKLVEIAKSYENVNTIARSFRRKANKLSDIVRYVGTLLGEDIWGRVLEGDSTISKRKLPKLNLITPSEVPNVYIQKKVLTTLIFPSPVELVMSSYEHQTSYNDNMLFLSIADSDLDEMTGNMLVKLKNGDVYPIKLKLTNDENEADLLLEIKSEK